MSTATFVKMLASSLLGLVVVVLALVFNDIRADIKALQDKREATEYKLMQLQFTVEGMETKVNSTDLNVREIKKTLDGWEAVYAQAKEPD